MPYEKPLLKDILSTFIILSHLLGEILTFKKFIQENTFSKRENHLNIEYFL